MTRDEQLIRAALEMSADMAAELDRCAECYDALIASAAIRYIPVADVLAKVDDGNTAPTRDDPLTLAVRAALDMAEQTINVLWLSGEPVGPLDEQYDTALNDAIAAIRAIDPAEVLAKVGAEPAPDAVARLVDAARALGAMPEGYCFCSANRVGDDSKIHEPECADLRDALIAKENEQCQVSIGPATGATINGPHGSGAGAPAAVDNSHTDAVARLVEAARDGLNYLENTEGEFGIILGSATGLRAALAQKEDER